MTAVCALALAAATLTRSANVGVAAGLAGWAITVLGGRVADGSLTAAVASASLVPPYLAVRGGVRRRHVVCDPDPERNVMNVEISDLTRRFGRTQAVDGVSLETGAGVFGLLGPNGAGKTSLLRMMATVLPPTSGTLRLLGRDPGHYGAAAGDPAQARLPAAEPRLLPGLHGRGLRRVLRAAQGDAARGRCRGRWRPRSSRSASATRPGRSCAPCPAGCCAGSASPRPS